MLNSRFSYYTPILGDWWVSNNKVCYCYQFSGLYWATRPMLWYHLQNLDHVGQDGTIREVVKVEVTQFRDIRCLPGDMFQRSSAIQAITWQDMAYVSLMPRHQSQRRFGTFFAAILLCVLFLNSLVSISIGAIWFFRSRSAYVRSMPFFLAVSRKIVFGPQNSGELWRFSACLWHADWLAEFFQRCILAWTLLLSLSWLGNTLLHSWAVNLLSWTHPYSDLRTGSPQTSSLYIPLSTQLICVEGQVIYTVTSTLRDWIDCRSNVLLHR